MRDVLTNRVPFVFTRELYATAALEASAVFLVPQRSSTLGFGLRRSSGDDAALRIDPLRMVRFRVSAKPKRRSRKRQSENRKIRSDAGFAPILQRHGRPAHLTPSPQRPRLQWLTSNDFFSHPREPWRCGSAVRWGSCPSPYCCSPNRAASQTTLRVATWNIETAGSPGSSEYNAALGVLGRIDADVVALNEIASAADASNLEALAADAGYTSLAYNSGAAFGSDRNAILSKHPFAEPAIEHGRCHPFRRSLGERRHPGNPRGRDRRARECPRSHRSLLSLEIRDRQRR